jgi:hypothetical protein
VSGPCLSSSVADHPLRPATRLCLGGLLPHQQADRPRAPPKAPFRAFSTADRCLRATSSINSSFLELSQSLGQVAHVLLTRLPLSLLSFNRSVHLENTVRLACLNHAASVHSEPGSNSPNHTCCDSGVHLNPSIRYLNYLIVRNQHIC